jgi:hypothetical protein
VSTPVETIQILFQVRNARKRGPTSSDQYNDSIEEIAHDFAALSSQWNNRLVPVISALPDGTVDSTIDAYANGLDGSNMYVDADSSVSSNSTYYNTLSTRPYTVLEQFNNVYTLVNTIQDTLESEINSSTVTASQVAVVDTAGLYVGTNVETCLAEVIQQAVINNGGGSGGRLAVWNNTTGVTGYSNLDWDGSTFTVDGDIHATGDITATGSISDQRFKKEVQPIKNALDNINDLSPVTFRWNDLYEQYNPQDLRPQYGLLAQEVRGVYPYAVNELKSKKYGDKKYLGVDYEKLVPLLLAGIQELTARVKELESQIGANND